RRQAGVALPPPPPTHRPRRSWSRGISQAPWSRSIHEYDGLAAIEDHAILQVTPHGPRQHAALDVAALAHEIVRRIAMADALDVLVDDRALVEVAGDVMRGGTDQLDAALMRLMIGPRTLEARQERVMDVDAA